MGGFLGYYLLLYWNIIYVFACFLQYCPWQFLVTFSDGVMHSMEDFLLANVCLRTLDLMGSLDPTFMSYMHVMCQSQLILTAHCIFNPPLCEALWYMFGIQLLLFEPSHDNPFICSPLYRTAWLWEHLCLTIFWEWPLRVCQAKQLLPWRGCLSTVGWCLPIIFSLLCDFF